MKEQPFKANRRSSLACSPFFKAFLSTAIILISVMLLLANTANAAAATSLAESLEEQRSGLKLPKNADAYTLRVISRGTLQTDGHWRQTHYISVYINSLAAARDYGRIVIPYNHYYTDTQLDFANVLSKSDKTIPLADDAVQVRVTGGGQDFYSDSSELAFSLPDISAGSTIEFQYTQTSRTLAFAELFTEDTSPFWFQRTQSGDSWRVDPVAHFDYSWDAPTAKTLNFKAYAGFPNKPKIKKQGDTTLYRWQMNNIAGVKIEDWMPPMREIAPRLIISSSTNWADVDRWTWNKVVGKLSGSDAVKAAVDSLNLPANADRTRKIKAVYRYLQDNIRYVFAHLGRGGYEPHTPDEVLAARYGDCKDQSVLATAMLQALGVDAYPALVQTPRSGRSDTALVRLFFDHMIVYIPGVEGGAELWLDTTGDRVLYPGLSAYLGGQNAMIVDGKGGKLTNIPARQQPSKATLALTYSETPEDRVIVDAEFQFDGHFEENFRQWWKSTTEQESSLDQYLKTLFNQSLNYTVTGDVKHSEDLWQPVVVKARYKFPKRDNTETPVLHAASFAQIFNQFGGGGGLQKPSTRVNRFVDPFAYDLEMQVHFQGAETTLPAVVQTSDSMDTPYFTLTQTGRAENSDYLLNLHMQRRPLELSVSEYHEYYKAIETLSRVESWVVSMQKDPQQESATTLADQQKQFGEQSWEYQLALAKKLMDDGKFEEALEPAQNAVARNDESGEAWYVLGTLQGFNTLIEESSQSFKKAEQLGYLP